MQTKVAERSTKSCSLCARKINVIIYQGGGYRGGHYFGKVPLHSKQELDKSRKAGTYKSQIGGRVFEVLNRSPKAYGFLEYWECPRCYWNIC